MNYEDDYESENENPCQEHFSPEEYTELKLGRSICKNGFLYQLQTDGNIAMIDVCE